MFIRLEIQITQVCIQLERLQCRDYANTTKMVGEVDPENPMNENLFPGAHAPPLVDEFNSLIEARENFECLAQSYMKEIHLTLEDHTAYAARLESWGRAFDKWTEKHKDHLNPSERRAIPLLRMHQTFFRLSNSMAIDHRGRDDFDFPLWSYKTPFFNEIMDYAEQATEPVDDVDPIAVFSLDSGIVNTMFFTISRSPDIAVRRRAIRLLSSSCRQEGVWNSDLALKVAERVASLETGGIEDATQPQDYSIGRRIRQVRLRMDPEDKRMTVRYESGPDSVEEELIWN